MTMAGFEAAPALLALLDEALRRDSTGHTERRPNVARRAADGP